MLYARSCCLILRFIGTAVYTCIQVSPRDVGTVESRGRRKAKRGSQVTQLYCSCSWRNCEPWVSVLLEGKRSSQQELSTFYLFGAMHHSSSCGTFPPKNSREILAVGTRCTIIAGTRKRGFPLAGYGCMRKRLSAQGLLYRNVGVVFVATVYSTSHVFALGGNG